MRRFLVAADLLGVFEVGHFLLDGQKAALQLEDFLLLPVELVAERGYGFVLQGRKAFELIDSFFHTPTVANRARKGSGLMGFYIEAFGGAGLA